MPASVTGNDSLHWVATVDTTQIKRSLEQLKADVQSLDTTRTYTKDIERLKEANRKTQELEKEISRMKNIGKIGYNELGDKIQKASGFTNTLKANVGQLAATFGLVFGIGQVVEWGKQLTKIAVEASGIERAFARLGGSQYLAQLRKETKGFVTDLELQKLAVQASNLGVPLKNLGTLLAFASQRAKDTGMSVEKLTDDIINGLGRQSTRIIDNLGISQRAVNAEILKTGDFTQAVTNIIVRETAVAGKAVDTLADKAGRTTTTLSNFFKDFAVGITAIFNPDLADNVRIGDITERLKKKYADFKTYTLEEQARLIAEQEKNIAAFDQRLDKVNKEKDLGRYDRNRRGTSQINNELKNLNEQKAATQNLVAEFKKLSLEKEKQERLAQGLITINELQAKQQRAQENAYGESDPEKRKAFLKEAEEIQKQIDDILGKSLKAREKKEESAYQKAIKLRKSLLVQISDIDTEYNLKFLSKEEAEVQAVHDKFKKIKSAVVEFNRSKAVINNPILKIQTDSLDKTETKVVEDLLYKQATERLKISLEEQRELYENYESYKKNFGEQSARERFGKDLDLAKKYFDTLNEEYYNLSRTPEKDRSEVQKQRLKAITDLRNLELAQQQKTYDELAQQFLNYEQQISILEENYQRDRAILIENRNKEAADALDKVHADNLSAMARQKLESTQVYQDLFQGIEDTATKSARNLVNKAREMLKSTALNPRDRKDIERFLRDTEAALDARIPQGMINVANNINGIASSVANVDEAFSSVLRTIADVIGGAANIKTSLAAIKDIKENPMGGLEDLLGVAGAAAGGIGAAISVATSLYNLFDRSEEKAAEREAERQAQLEKTQAAIEGINRALELQEKVIQKALGVDRIQAYRNQLGMLSSDISKTIDKINGLSLTQKTPTGTAWGDSVKQINVGLKKLGDQMSVSYLNYGFPATYTVTLDTLEKLAEANQNAIKSFYEGVANGTITGNNLDQVKELVASYEELEAKLEEYQLKLKEVVTGTTFSSIVDSISSGFRQGFADAEDEAKFFADTFEDLLRDAIIQSLKFKALEKPLAQFYDDFAKFSELDASGVGLTADEIKTLRDTYNEIISNAAKEFESLKDITGVKFGPGSDKDNQRGLAGAFKALSDDTGNLLAGQYGAQRLLLAEIRNILSNHSVNFDAHYDVAMDILRVNMQIEVNTRLLQQQNLQTNAKLDSHTTILSNIERGVRASTDAIIANGG